MENRKKICKFLSPILAFFCISCGKPVEIKDDAKASVRDVAALVPSNSSDGVNFNIDSKSGSGELSMSMDSQICSSQKSQAAVFSQSASVNIPQFFESQMADLSFVQTRYISSTFPVILKCIYKINYAGMAEFSFCVDDATAINKNNYYSFHQNSPEVLVNIESRAQHYISMKPNDAIIITFNKNSQVCSDLSSQIYFEIN